MGMSLGWCEQRGTFQGSLVIQPREGGRLACQSLSMSLMLCATPSTSSRSSKSSIAFRFESYSSSAQSEKVFGTISNEAESA
mmetsp:Transcript_9308/g.18993  ORF Transcript_9308/g.18993 Transcript_9308/m.18993 type:complete len:82 (+) Transcript_9308:741-986(+)